MVKKTSAKSKKSNLALPSEEVIKAYALKNALQYKGKASQGAVLSGLFAEGLEKSEIPKIIPKIQKVLQKVNSMSPESQQKEFKKLESKTSKRKIREGLKELPNARAGEVVMRIAPFPSGPLHIGNARNIILNDEYIKTYKGKLILYFDDTIGSENKKIEPEAYKLIQEGLDWLGIKYDKKILYKSDRIETYYKYAEEMLKKGYLYVCHCSQEKMQELKSEGVSCSCREISPKEQLKRWKEMFKAKMGSMTVRLKTNMQDPDPAFRDRVMFKISDLPHPKLKNKFRVYPSMEFGWAIDDHAIGSTHILRGIDHQMSTRVQDFIRNIFKWPNPESIYNGHLAIEGVKISKSQGTQKIKSGEYMGWNDPRTWSLQSLRDRGINPEAIREFILSLGIKKTSITTPIENLYKINKKFIEKSPKYFFIENPQKITIKGCPPLSIKISKPQNKSSKKETIKTTQEFLISKKDFELLENEECRLTHLLNFKSSRTGIKPKDFSFISTEPSQEKTKFLSWLPATQNNIEIEIMMPNGQKRKGLGESSLEKLKIGNIVNFEKFGFAKLHKKYKDRLEFWFTQN